jgi:Holliday junction resolvasome RuvABC endonuclease subunit
MMLLNRGRSPPKKGDEALRGMSIHNLVYVASSIGEELSKRKPQLVMLEDYSGGSGPQAVHLPFIGEVAGAAKLWMHQQGVPWMEIAAATLKKFVTGSGAGKKEVMWLGAYKRWGIDQATLGDDNNVLDAYCLARAALVVMWARDPAAHMTKSDLDTLKKAREGGSPRERAKKGKKAEA